MLKLDKVLSEVSDLSLFDKELLEDILHKRIVEEKRDEIYSNYQKSLKSYKNGEVKSGNAKDLFKDLGS